MKDLSSLRVSLSLDSAHFSKNLTDINRRLKVAQSEFKATSDGTKAYENSLEGLKAQQSSLVKQLDLQKERVHTLRKEYEKSKNDIGENAKETENLAKRLNWAIHDFNKVESSLKSVNSRVNDATNKWKILSRQLNETGQHFKDLGDKVSGVGRTLSMGISAPLAGIGTLALKTSMDFQEGMSKVKAVSGATSADMKKLEKQARELGASTSYSAKEAADGMAFLAQAGYKTNDILAAMPDLLSLAKAGAMDLGQASDIASNILSGFGLEAKKTGHVADVLAKAAANANTDVYQLGEAMKYLAPSAKSLGWGLEEATAAVMAMSDAGIQGSLAGQAFASSLGRLSKPVGDMNKVIAQTGMQFFDAQGKMKPMPELIKEIEKATSGMTAKQKAATLTTLFGAEAYKHWAVLLDKGSTALGANTEMLERSNGAAKKMAKTMGDNLKGKIKEFNSAMQELAIKLGDHVIPMATKFTGKLTTLANAFGDLSPATQKTILALGGLGIVIPPLIIAGGALTSALGSIAMMAGKVSMAIAGAGGVSGALAVLASPITGTIAGLGLLGIGFYKLHQHMKKPSEEADVFKGKISESTKEAYGSYKKLRDDTTAELLLMKNSHGEITTQMADSIAQKYREMGDKILQAMQENHTKQLLEAAKLFKETDTLTEQEEQKRLDELKARQEAEVNEHKKKEARIQEILAIAKEGKRNLTMQEYAELDQLTKDGDSKALANLTKTQNEQLLIKRNMKDQSKAMSTEEVAHQLTKAYEWRDKTISNANKVYKDKVASITKLRDESKVISADEAATMIKNAKDERDESVRAAKQMADGTVKEAKKRKDANINNINLETGGILSGYDKLARGIQTAVNWIRGLFGLKPEKKIGEIGFSKHQKDLINKYGGKNAKKKYAKGTINGTHIGGEALVGEEGYELAHIPNKGMTLVGVGGQEVIDLPRGSAVLPHKQTKQMLQKYHFPAYASGTGKAFSWFKDKWEDSIAWIGNKAEQGIDYMSNAFDFDLISSSTNKIWDWALGKAGKFNDSFFPKALGSPMEQAKGFALDYIKELKDSFTFDFGGGDIASLFGGAFRMTSGYGMRWGSLHKGYDYAAPSGTPIPSQSGGTVISAGFGKKGSGFGGYGNYVLVDAGNGLTFLYGHNSKNLVKKGDKVSKGQIIGLVGSTGQSTGPHVHFEVRRNGKAFDFGAEGLLGTMSKHGKGVEQWRGVATKALMMTGQYSPSNLQKLLYQMKTESGGNPRAINLWDINAKRGIPSKGLMQVIDPTFKRYAMKGYDKNIYDPLSNILASIRYALARYGSLARAYRGVGYEKGGFINKEHLAMVGEGNKKEAIIPLEQYSKRAKQIWLKTGEMLGMFNLQPMTMDYGSVGALQGVGTTNNITNHYNIYVDATINNDQDIEELAVKIQQSIEKKENQKNRALGVRF